MLFAIRTTAHAQRCLRVNHEHRICPFKPAGDLWHVHPSCITERARCMQTTDFAARRTYQGRVHNSRLSTCTLSCIKPLPHCICNSHRKSFALSCASLEVSPCTISASGHMWPGGVCGDPGPSTFLPAASPLPLSQIKLAQDLCD